VSEVQATSKPALPNFRLVLEISCCQIEETIVTIYLINDAIVLIVDTRLRLPTEILLKGMQQEQGP